jgi:hypothetical protein
MVNYKKLLEDGSEGAGEWAFIQAGMDWAMG